MDARESHDHVVAQPIQRVVGPTRRDAFEGKVGPLRELPGEQPPDERLVGVDLVDVHPHQTPRGSLTGLTAFAVVRHRVGCSPVTGW